MRLPLLVLVLASLVLADVALAKPKEIRLPNTNGPVKKPKPVRLLEAEVGELFTGGQAPFIDRLDLDGREIKVRQGGRAFYFYGVQAVVRRASGDKSRGVGTVYRAPGQGRWRDALKDLSGTDPSIVDLVPGNLIQRGLNQPFPPIKQNYRYKIFRGKPPALIGRVVSPYHGGKKKRFLQNLGSMVFPAGEAWVGIQACTRLADHPLKTAKGAATVASRLKLIKDTVGWVRFAGLLGIPLSLAVSEAKRLALEIALDSKQTCSTTYVKVLVPAVVPRLLGMGRIPAHREIRNRSLRVEVLAPRQCSDAVRKKLGTRRVVSQIPRVGSLLQPGQAVKVRYCAKKKPPGVPADSWTGTWDQTYGTRGQGNMVLIQTGNKVRGCYERENSTITGTVKMVNGKSVLVGEWENREITPDKGPLEFTLSKDGKSFTGVWAYELPLGSTTNWSGTRVSKKTDAKGICDLP